MQTLKQDGTDMRQTEVKAFRAASSSARLTDKNKEEDEEDIAIGLHCIKYTGWRKKRGQWAILSNCKYSENSMTEFRGNWWTSAKLYAEHSH